MQGKSRAWNWLIQNVPATESEWRARQCRLGLNTATQYEETIRGLVDEDDSLQPNPTRAIETSPLESLITLTRTFSQSTQRSSASAALHRATAAFKRLILLSLCLILRHQGLSEESIDHIITWLSPVQRVRENCLKGIAWVYDAIRTLHVEHGWTEPQATELFFLIPLSVSRLGEIHPIDVTAFARYVPEWPGWTSLKPNFTLPSLVWRLCRRSRDTNPITSCKDVCRILGNHNDAELTDDVPFRVTAPSQTLKVELFQPEARDLMPQLQAWFEHLRNAHGSTVPLNIREQLIEISVGVSRIQSPIDPPLFASVLDLLYLDDISRHLHFDLVRAQSTFLRSLGAEGAVKSNQMIKSTLWQSEQALKLPDRRIRCSIYGLWFSLIENAVLLQDFETALSTINHLELPEHRDTWPELDFQIARQTLTLRGLVFRGLGRFQEAAEVLDACSKICESHGNRGTHPHHLNRHRAELLCELGRPEEALDILRKSLADIRGNGVLNDSRAHRRLCLANAEAAALAMRPGDAEVSLENVETCFRKKPPEMPVDQLDHVRVYLVRMRLARHAKDLAMALVYVTKAVDLLQQYRFVKGREYFTTLALKFRASIYLELAKADEGRLEVSADRTSQHLVVGMGSYGRDEILKWFDDAKSGQSPNNHVSYKLVTDLGNAVRLKSISTCR
ncbi:hypothetical protein M409DRAFT_19292 [Zasmidium cellare ATCC 36951]|uniref:MalT-like TPR region domain-containing protein n=1 Tax=Zasmidium cellare ATCC 36951 TaxID=1080233 RepID=A0A6A6CTP9_ZASCE|nr:uncharacterized protein M409DRAFT_19292 [Zasmidium cellare ATCC 36951]KAF2170471.1 hypothetical protein M409DRAFT_19292 [Zasmidium cellare ATCC 36951]